MMTPPVALLEGIGGPELLFIAILALLMFGSKRLPDLGRSFGRAMREFKRATSGVEENLREVMREDPAPRIRPARKPAARPKPTKEPEEEKPPPIEAEAPTFSDSVSDDFAEEYGGGAGKTDDEKETPKPPAD